MSESENTAIEPTSSNVPDLVRTPAFEITAEDVALPRLKIGQYMSNFVQDGAVPPGCLFLSLSADDGDPQVLYEIDDDEPLVFHVLNLIKGKSISQDGELVTWDFNDPDAPADAWVTYKYGIALPEYDEDVPATFLLTRTGKPAAQQINMVLAKNASKQPPHATAFAVETVARSNDKGKYFVPRVRHIEATEKGQAVAEKLSDLIQADSASVQATGEEPAI